MTTKDPICGMSLNSEKAPRTSSFSGQTYYFCGQACKEKFESNPQFYASKKETTKSPQAHA